MEKAKWILRRGKFTSFHGNLMESQTEITCIPLQHELKQETIKSALEADVYTAWKISQILNTWSCYNRVRIREITLGKE